MTIGFRPEHVIVTTDKDSLRVEVDVVEELGADAYLYCHTSDLGQSGSIVVVRIDGREKVARGDRLQVKVLPEHTHGFSTETGMRISNR